MTRISTPEIQVKRMNKYILSLVVLIALLLSSCGASKQATSSVLFKKYSFEAVDSLSSIAARPIAVFLYADWCTFCKNMEQTTFKDARVVELLNEQYYFIPFDGEQEQSVQFSGKTFHYQPTGRHTGTHELAVALGTINNTLSYPTFVLLDTEQTILFQTSGYIDKLGMQTVLMKGLDSN